MKEFFNSLKSKVNIKNALFLLVCVVLAHYGLYYGILTNVRLMIFAGVFILVRSIYLTKIPFDLNMLFLFEGFVIKAMLDQHTGKAWKVPTTLAMPVLMYLFGKYIVAVRTSKKTKLETKITPEGPAQVEVIDPSAEKTEGVFTACKRAVLALCFTAVGMTIYGLMNYRMTRQNTIIANMGYYFLAFREGEYSRFNTFMFSFIPAISIILALLAFGFYKLAAKNESLNKIKHYVVLIVFTIMSLAGIWIYLHDIRWQAFKEAVHLMVTEHWGNFNFTVLELNTSSNMWLDYGRESGILVLVPILIFFGLAIKDAIQLALNKNVGIFTKTLVLSAFILFNVYYFIESDAFTFQFYWFIGLAVSGAISVLRLVGKEE
jgi:hypothetical protein